jgi:hypothetical protein
MSRVISLKLTLFILSIKGMRKMMPGPLEAMSLPRRKITPLSYSFKILITCDKTKKMIKAAIR